MGEGRGGVGQWLRQALVWWHRWPQPLRALLPLLGMALLWWSSSRTPAGGPHGALRALVHNGAHVFVYGCLAAAFWGSWGRTVAVPRPGRPGGRELGAWLCAVAYGVVDELHQSYVPGRVCSFADLVSDAAGAAFATLTLCGLFGDGRARRFSWAALVLGAISVLAATFAGW